MAAHDSLRHDVAFSTARHIVEAFAGCLREEEKRDAFTAYWKPSGAAEAASGSVETRSGTDGSVAWRFRSVACVAVLLARSRSPYGPPSPPRAGAGC